MRDAWDDTPGGYLNAVCDNCSIKYAHTWEKAKKNGGIMTLHTGFYRKWDRDPIFRGDDELIKTLCQHCYKKEVR
jgi:hypothetical protein